MILGDQNGQGTTVKANKNEISGAYFGVLVDENVAEINFTGNTLTGDNVPGSGDIGICSDAQRTDEKGKPNNINDFDDRMIEGGCLTP